MNATPAIRCLLLAALWGAILASDALANPRETFELLHGRNSPVETRLAVARTAWAAAGLTAPAPDAATYVYLIHSLNQLSLTGTKHNFATGEDIDLLREPQRVSEFPVLSLSLISEQKSVTYAGNVGLILRVPADAIFAASAEDMQSFDVRDAFASGREAGRTTLVERFERFGLPPPADLLEMTPNSIYNEVLVTGTSDSGIPVQVVGFYMKEIEGLNPLKLWGAIAALEDLAAAKGLPLVTIRSRMFDPSTTAGAGGR